MMTCEEGYKLAKRQRPGVVVVMGPECAKLRAVQPQESKHSWFYTMLVHSFQMHMGRENHIVEAGK